MWESLKQDWAYRGFQFRDIKKKEYRHLFLLLFWPIYLFAFFGLEILASTNGYSVVHCALDDKIPFCEYFIIPYVIWYPFWILMVLYSVSFEVPVFVRLMKYMIVTLTISLIIYSIWPNGQEMWPDEFPRKNFFSWLTGIIYKLDHNTNVCPSEHVSTGFGVVFAASVSKRFSKKWILFLFWLEAVLVAVSVTFVKQHSVVDVIAAIPVILIGYFVGFHIWGSRKEKADEKRLAMEEQKAAKKQGAEQEDPDIT